MSVLLVINCNTYEEFLNLLSFSRAVCTNLIVLIKLFPANLFQRKISLRTPGKGEGRNYMKYVYYVITFKRKKRIFRRLKERITRRLLCA